MEDICHCGVKHGGQLIPLVCFRWNYMLICRQLNQDFYWPYPLESLDKCIYLCGGHLNLGFLILCWMPANLGFCLQLRMRYPELVSCIAQIVTYQDMGGCGVGVLRLRSHYRSLRVYVRQSTSLCCRISANIPCLSPDLVMLALVPHCSVTFWSEQSMNKTTDGWRLFTSIGKK